MDRRILLSISLVWSMMLPLGTGWAATPESAPAELWNQLRGKNILTWTPQEQRLGYPNIRSINPVRDIPASEHTWVLEPALWPEDSDWADQMEALHLAGLLVIQDGKIRLEKYRQGHNENQRWMSFSIAKSVVSLLYGVAISEGLIQSLEERVSDYLPQFADTGYGDVELRHLLHMASGVRWSEDYQDPHSDVAKLDNATEAEVLAHLASLPAIHAPGTVFNYNTGETILAGAILAKAVGMNLSEFLSSRIWSPAGMEHDADWALMGAGGAEMGGCCISATLRDYGRLGLLTLSAKANNHPGSAPVTHAWMQESTTPSPAAPYYGYFWWLTGEDDYRASGIYGQAIHVSPSHNLVIAMHGLWPNAVDDELSEKRRALVAAIKRAATQSASD